MPAPLLLVGAGGLGREVAEVARATDAWDLVGWADDDPALWGTEIDGLPVLGSAGVLLENESWSAVLCFGTGRTRARVVERLTVSGFDVDRFATVVHPTAVVPRSCSLGAGSILLAGTVLTASVVVGRHVVLMPGVVLTHDDVLADQVTLCARAALAGGVVVAAGAYLGTGCTVREHLAVGAWSTVGMGSVVLQDVPAHEVWAGVPARQLRDVRRQCRVGEGELSKQSGGSRLLGVEGIRT